jgi:GNAT superfamily N-acetyltransferase
VTPPPPAPGTYEIGPASATDLDGCRALWRQCGLPEGVPAHDGDAVTLLVARRHHPDGAADEVAGCVAARLEGETGWLLKLAVEPALRGTGLARRLMRAGEDWLKTRGAAEARVLLGPTDDDARRVGRAFGYAHQPATVQVRQLHRDRADAPAAGGTPPEGTLRNVVTFLEMHARPRLPAVHPPSNLQTALMRCVAPTVAFYRFLYDTVGAPWLWWERRALDDASLAEIVQDERVEIYVLYVEGQPAGYAELDRRREPEIELAYFGLMPEFIGQRLGPYLLASAIDIAWSHEPSRLWVNTNTLDHPKALPLYQRMGFVPYAQEEKIVEDPRSNGLIPA